MRARLLGYTAAILFHLLVLLFGGALFLKPDAKEKERTVREVDLVEAEAGKPEEQKEEPVQEAAPVEETDQPIVEEVERPPEVRQAIDLDASPAASASALEALSLSALEGALNPTLAGADGFGGSASLASGGRIGGTGSGIDAGAAADAVFAVADLNQAPRVIFQVAPTYPLELRRRKIEGTVQLAFIVDQQGRVVSPKVESSTHAAFEGPALEAIKQWKFEPGIRDQEKVQSKMRVPIRFSAAG
jgi:protein TonB